MKSNLHKNKVSSQIAFGLVSLLFLVSCAKTGNHMPLPDLATPAGQTGSGKPEQQKECSIVTEFEVGYKEDILPVVEKNCKLCHQAGALNWTDYKTFSGAKAKILNRVFDQQNMPPKGMPQPSGDELSLLKKWIEIGTPESKKVIDNSQCPKDDPAPVENNPPVKEPVQQPEVPPAQPPQDPAQPPAPEPPAQNPPNANPEYTYELNVKPILSKYCFICHSAGDLDWSNYDNFKKRVDNGVLERRLFITKDMPMSGFQRPSDEELEVIRVWMVNGAPQGQAPVQEPPPVVEEPKPENPPVADPNVLTYVKDIKPILNQYCMICHSAGDLNWGEYANLKKRVDNKALETRLFVKKDMPMSGFAKPNDLEYETIKKWIEAGAPEQ